MVRGHHGYGLVVGSEQDPGGGAALGRKAAELQGITPGMGPDLIGSAHPVPTAGFTVPQQKQDHRESGPQRSIWALDRYLAAMDLPVPAPLWMGLQVESRNRLLEALHGVQQRTALSKPMKKPPLVEGARGFHQGLFSLSKALSLSRGVWP